MVRSEETRAFIEAECLRFARKVPGCKALESLTIKRAEEGSGRWYVERFNPTLPPNLAKEARQAIVKQVLSKHLMAFEKSCTSCGETKLATRDFFGGTQSGGLKGMCRECE